MKPVVLISYLVCLGVAWHMLRYAIKPALMLFLLWTVVLLASVLFVPEYYFSPRAALFVLFMLIIAFSGSVIVHDGGSFRISGPRYRLDHRSIAWIAVGTLSGVASCLIVIYTTGYSLGHLLDLDRYLTMASSLSVERYEYDYRIPLLARILMAPAHCAAMVVATRHAAGIDTRRWQRVVGFMPFVPAVLLAAILTTRATVLFMGVLYVSTRLAIYIYLFPGRLGIGVSAGKLLRLGSVVVLVGVLFVALQFARGGISDLSRTGEILFHLRKWPLGSMPAFSYWYDGYSVSPGPDAYGYYTFMGIFSLTGLQPRATGIFLEQADIATGEFTNVFSAFRGLLMDYGVVGCAMVMFLVGAFGGVLFDRTRRGRAYAITGLIGVYAFVLFSPIVSFYAYTAHIAAIAMYQLYLHGAVTTGRAVRPVAS